MKVLLSAIACHPRLGSESKVGWETACAISQIAIVEECHVMTHIINREAIEQAQKAGFAGQVHFHFFGKPFRYHPDRMLARLQSWLLYRNWQRESIHRASQLHQKHRFALAHHVTYASWRVPSPLWRLPIPFVFGPVGGGSATPRAFRTILGRSATAFELLREATTFFSARARSLRLCCEKASAVVAADAATETFLAAHGASNIHRLCQVFFSDVEASRLMKRKRPRSVRNAKLAIFAGGNLEGRKGTQLSLRALALLQKKGIPFSYTYGGWGPDLQAMKQLSHDLEVAHAATFHEGYSGHDYTTILSNSDVYLLPSVRETAGITMMEATIAGCYPIVLAGTGSGDIVERTGGTAIHSKTPEEAVQQIAEKLEWCYRQHEEMQQQAEAAGENVRRLYSESSYQEAMSEIYKAAITSHARRLKEI
jgi:glycosyltransferase involved in cell wall biosynthesis